MPPDNLPLVLASEQALKLECSLSFQLSQALARSRGGPVLLKDIPAARESAEVSSPTLRSRRVSYVSGDDRWPTETARSRSSTLDRASVSQNVGDVGFEKPTPIAEAGAREALSSGSELGGSRTAGQRPAAPGSNSNQVNFDQSVSEYVSGPTFDKVCREIERGVVWVEGNLARCDVSQNLPLGHLQAPPLDPDESPRLEDSELLLNVVDVEHASTQAMSALLEGSSDQASGQARVERKDPRPDPAALELRTSGFVSRHYSGIAPGSRCPSEAEETKLASRNGPPRRSIAEVAKLAALQKEFASENVEITGQEATQAETLGRLEHANAGCAIQQDGSRSSCTPRTAAVLPSAPKRVFLETPRRRAARLLPQRSQGSRRVRDLPEKGFSSMPEKNSPAVATAASTSHGGCVAVIRRSVWQAPLVTKVSLLRWSPASFVAKQRLLSSSTQQPGHFSSIIHEVQRPHGPACGSRRRVVPA